VFRRHRIGVSKLRQRIVHLSHLLFVAAFLLFAAAAHAATVTGTVRNGTNGKPAVGVDVVLIQLQGEMQSVASTKTDAQGRYTLDNPAGGRDAMPMLVRAIYRGVNFHQPLPPGQSTADVTVYEPSSDPKTIKVGTRVMMFQPNGSSLLVVDDYSLANASQPPVALYDANGDFEFDLPDGAENSQVSASGPSRMPVNQGTINKGKGKYAIAYAFQPGDNDVRVSYQVPYPSNKTTLRFASAHSADRVGLIAPTSLQIQGAGFTPQGQQQGFNLYARDAVAAGTAFEVSISGTAPPPTTADQGGGQPDTTATGTSSSAAIQVLPNRLDSLKWMLLGGFGVLFSLGVVSIWRRPVAVGVEMSPATAPPAPLTSRRAGKRAAEAAQQLLPVPPAPAAAPLPAPSAAVAVETIAAVEREVEQGLDGLKDKLFRLELRHQAGTISEEEYRRERTQAETILRELVGR
jgi:hypothetical protein